MSEENHTVQYEDLVRRRQEHIGRYFWRAHRAFGFRDVGGGADRRERRPGGNRM